jgi:hypothetical protein
MEIIVKMIFGSQLYGTSIPQSDTDYKGVFMPPIRDIILGRISKSVSSNTKRDGGQKNKQDDVDSGMYSLHYFIHLACEGETVAIDMLHAPQEMIIEKSAIWDDIVANRGKFYTKNLRAFVGYARRQAAKYGIKGSRLNEAGMVLDFLKTQNQFSRLRECWDSLPCGEHIFKHPPNENNERMYEVCGRKVGENAIVDYAQDVIGRFYAAYGERAKQAARNEGIDWKAISHALRAAYQVRELLTTGTITFPLKDADYLRDVKQAKHDYQSQVAPKMEELMDEVERLSAASSLPEKADREFWDNFIIQKVMEIIQR